MTFLTHVPYLLQNWSARKHPLPIDIQDGSVERFNYYFLSR